MRTYARLLVLGVAVVMTGCTAAPQSAPTPEPSATERSTPSASPTPSSAPTPTKKAPAAPKLDAELVADGFAAADDKPIAVTESGVVFAGPDKIAYLMGADGTQQWRLPRQLTLGDADEPRTIDHVAGSFGEGPADLIAADYRCDAVDCIGENEYGVAGFSTEDGDLQWSRSISGDEGPIAVADVTEDAVIVELRTSDEEQRAITALDADSGDRLWTLSGYAASWVSGDHVLAQRVNGPDLEDWTPVVVDLESGEVVLTSEHRGTWRRPEVDLYESAEDLAAIAVRPGAGDTTSPHTVLVDLARERQYELTDGFQALGSLGRDSDGAYFAWPGQESGTVLSSGLPIRAPKVGESADLDQFGNLRAATGRYLWLDSDTSTTAIDRTGARRLDPVEGTVRAVTGDWLVTETDGLNVYRLTPDRH